MYSSMNELFINVKSDRIIQIVVDLNAFLLKCIEIASLFLLEVIIVPYE